MTIQTQNESLEALLAHLRGELSDLRIQKADSDLANALFAILRLMLVHAEATRMLAKTPAAEATGANVRAAFEAWIDIRYILSIGDPMENALRNAIFGLLEFGNYARDATTVSAEELQHVAQLVEYYRDKAPSIVAEEEARFTDKRRPLYWSGKSRAKMLDLIDAKDPNVISLSRVYRLFSWDAHHVINVALESRQIGEDGKEGIQIVPKMDPSEVGVFNSAIIARMLGDAWVKICRALRIKQASTGPG
jgi:hypothetical protein